jgi:hypothetical protein
MAYALGQIGCDETHYDIRSDGHGGSPPNSLGRMLNLLQKANVVFGQAVRSSPLPQQREIPKRRLAVVLIARAT